MLNREGENRTQLLQTILDISPNCIYVKDNQGRYLIANKTIADLYQTTPDEMIGKKDEDFSNQAILKPNEAEYFKDIDKKAIETKETQTIPCESFTYDDGTTHYFFTTKTPITYQDDHDCVMGISVDITKLKETEIQALENHKRLERIFSMSSELICEADINTATFTKINPAFLKVLGYSEEELLSKSFLNFIHPDDIEPTQKVIDEQLQRGKKVLSFINRYRCKDGSYVWLDWNSLPLPAEGIIHAVARDITEKKKAEEQLKESELLLKSSIESQKDTVILFLDKNYHYLFFNKTHEEDMINAYNRRPEIGKCIFNYMTNKEDIKKIKEKYDFVLKGNSDTSISEYGDAVKKYYEIRINPIYDKEKRIIGISSFARDITEKKKAEETLKESQVLLQKAENISNQGSWKWDIVNDVWNFSENWLNIHGCEHSGISREELMKLAHPDDVSKINIAFENALSNKKPYSIEHRIIRKDNGAVRIIKAKGEVHFLDDGKPSYMIGLAQDITERSKAEKELQESEKKYRTLFDTMAQGVVYQDANGEIISANPAAERILGLTLSQMQGRTSMHPQWKAVDKDNNILSGDKHPAMIALKTGEEICNFLQGVFNPERNDYVWIIVNSIPQFKPGNDKPYQVYSTFLDVTKRIQNQSEINKQNKELNQSKNETEMILNTAGDGIRIVTKDLKIKTVNDTFAEMVGLSKDEVIGRNCSDVFKSDVCGTDNCPLRKVLQTGEGFEEETSRTTLDDREIECILKVTPYRDEHGEIIGIIEDFRDITTLKKAQARFRSIFENKGTATGTFGDDNIITQCNSKFVEQSGYTKDEIIGKMHWYDFVHKDDIEEMMRFHKQRSAGGNPPGLYECRMVTKNGDIRTMIVNIGVIPDSKERVVSLVDITKQKNAEHKLEDLNRDLEKEVKDRTQKIKKLLIQKDEFINQLGHDIKNPLGPLVNLLPLLEKNENDPKKKDMIQVMNRNVRYIKNLVSRTIQLAQLKSPSTGLHYEHVNLSDEIKDVIDTNRLLFEENHITVQNNISDELRVDADRLKIHEVFNNLLNNAVKYNKEDGGDIIINQTFNDDDTLTISISDTGVGMTGEQLEKVFDEFYKADSSRHDFDSSGLGMSITKRIIELHGGKIWAESKGPGKGSTFYFTLPKSDSKS